MVAPHKRAASFLYRGVSDQKYRQRPTLEHPTLLLTASPMDNDSMVRHNSARKGAKPLLVDMNQVIDCGMSSMPMTPPSLLWTTNGTTFHPWRYLYPL